MSAPMNDDIVAEQNVTLRYRRFGPPWRRRWGFILFGFTSKSEAGSCLRAMLDGRVVSFTPKGDEP